MKLYLAGYVTSPDVLKLDKEFGILTSYLEVKNKHLIDHGRDLLLDSGAYSAMTRGIEIDIDDYIEYIRANENYIHTYANLDVVGDAEATNENQRIMEQAGLAPLPTFHYGSDYDYLREMIQEYDYIGLGGLVPISKKRKVLKAHLDNCWKIILEEKPNLKVHGWGMTSYFGVTRYPFFSVDSTSWLIGGRARERLIYDTCRRYNLKSIYNKAYGYHTINILNAQEVIKMVEDAALTWNHREIGIYGEN
jgi:hypothetical protein